MLRILVHPYSKYLIRADNVVVYPWVGNISILLRSVHKTGDSREESFRTDQVDTHGDRQ